MGQGVFSYFRDIYNPAFLLCQGMQPTHVRVLRGSSWRLRVKYPLYLLVSRYSVTELALGAPRMAICAAFHVY